MTPIQNSVKSGALFAKASRPQNAVYSGCMAIAAYIASGGEFLSTISICLFGFFTFMYALAALYNNLQDIATDRINRRFDNPFVKAKVLPWQLISFTIYIAAGITICASFLKLPVTLIISTLSLLIIFGYSNPSVHLKSRGFAGILTLGIFYSVLPILLGYLQNKPASLLLFFTCGAIYSVSLAGLLAKDYKDEAGDRALEVRTVLVRYGKVVVHKLAFMCFIVGAAIQIYAMLALNISEWGFILLAMYGYFVYLLHKNKGKLPHGYMRISQACLLAATYLNLA